MGVDFQDTLSEINSLKEYLLVLCVHPELVPDGVDGHPVWEAFKELYIIAGPKCHNLTRVAYHMYMDHPELARQFMASRRDIS